VFLSIPNFNQFFSCIGERWMDDTINDFCDLTYCAQWQSLRAKVKDYLKDPNDHRDTIWIELIDKVKNRYKSTDYVNQIQFSCDLSTCNFRI